MPIFKNIGGNLVEYTKSIIMSKDQLGVGKPDGTTITVDRDGTLHGVAEVTVDSELSNESLNPVQNKVIAEKIAEINNNIEELNTLLSGVNTSLDIKLDVSKIANNLVTTEEGYVLDARMGKALADKIPTLDYREYTLTASDFVCFEDIVLNYGKIVKNNNMVTISFELYNKTTLDPYNQKRPVLKLPEEFRPTCVTSIICYVGSYLTSIRIGSYDNDLSLLSFDKFNTNNGVGWYTVSMTYLI